MRRYAWLARSRSIRLLLMAWGLSYAGDLAAFTAASVYAYRTGGAGLVGILGLIRGLSGAFLVPLVTSWSDRVRRERLLVASVAPRALLLGAAAAAMTGDGRAVLVVVLVAVESGLASVFRQVQAALLPWLARTPDELTGANTAASLIQSAAMVGGPSIAASLLAVSTSQVAMVVACGLVAAGALLLAGVRPLVLEAPVRTAGRLRQLTRDLAAGWEAGVRRPGARALAVPAAAQTFGRGVLNVLTVVIALDLFSLGSAGVGWLTAVLGLGGLLGGPVAVLLVRDKRVARCFAGGVAGWGVPMIVLAFAHARYWPSLTFGVIGFANVIDDAGVYSALQQVIPSRLTGRALGVRRAPFVIAGVGISMAIPCVSASGLNAVSPQALGKAAGVMNTMQQFGAVFGIAVATTVFNGHGSLASAAAITSGYRPALGVSAGLSVLGAAAALGIRRAARAGTAGPGGPRATDPADLSLVDTSAGRS